MILCEELRTEVILSEHGFVEIVQGDESVALSSAQMVSIIKFFERNEQEMQRIKSELEE